MFPTIFPQEYIPLLGKLNDVDLAHRILLETEINVSRQTVRYWRKKYGIPKFDIYRTSERKNIVKKYIERTPLFSVNSIKRDLGIYVINNKKITKKFIIELIGQTLESKKYDTNTSSNQIRHGYLNKKCKCDICKLSKTIYQRYYTLKNPIIGKYCDAIALLHISKYKELGSDRFYIFLDSIVRPEMFKYPEEA